MTTPSQEGYERLTAIVDAMRANTAVPDTKAVQSLPEQVERMRALCPPKSEQEMRVFMWNREVLPNIQATRLPHRFHRQITEWTEPKQKAVFEACKRLFTGKGAIVALVGERGVGKTSIAAQLIIERAWNDSLQPWERRPPYRKLTDLIAMYKPLYADFGSIQTEELMERRDGFCKLHPLVVIDELHECDDQRLKDRVLTDILDRRYASNNDTLLITNQTPQEFKQTTNDSVLSRLSEHGSVIACAWRSFRERAA